MAIIWRFQHMTNASAEKAWENAVGTHHRQVFRSPTGHLLMPFVDPVLEMKNFHSGQAARSGARLPEMDAAWTAWDLSGGAKYDQRRYHAIAFKPHAAFEKGGCCTSTAGPFAQLVQLGGDGAGADECFGMNAGGKDCAGCMRSRCRFQIALSISIGLTIMTFPNVLGKGGAE
eukprot:scaffold2963_cov250-Pinguiococcus_pyrenoidosus.AAC.35